MRMIRRALGAFTALAITAGLTVAVPTANGAENPDTRASACKLDHKPLLGIPIPQAKERLREMGCANIRVRLRCAPRDKFGLVVAVRPKPGTWAADTRVIIYRGVRATPDGPCPVTEYDGVYEFRGSTGTQTCSVGSFSNTSPFNLLPDGQQFTLRYGHFSGNPVFGTVADDGGADVTLQTGEPRFPELTGFVGFEPDAAGVMTATGILTGGFGEAPGTICTVEQRFRAVRIEESPS